jgi:glycosyltransferase involved in cell wall biosynthesis
VILVVHDGHGPLRGSEHVMLTLLDNVDPGQFRWVVLTNQPEFADATRSRGIPTEFHPFRMLFVEGLNRGDLADFLRFSALATRIVRRYGVSLIHVNNGGTCAWMVAVAIWCRLPLLVHLHAIWSARMQVLLGMHHADRIVGVSQHAIRKFQTDPVARHRTRVIYNGVSLARAPQQNRAEAKQELGIPADNVAVAVIGSLVPGKRVDVAIDALRLLPDDVSRRTTLVVIGEGPQDAALKARAQGLPVCFTGHRDDVPALLQNAIDMVVVTSASEALNLTLLEAAAAGLPRIASNVGGTAEAVAHEVGGLLVPAGDPAALAEAMARVIRDPDLALRYGAAAKASARQEFGVEQFLQRFTTLYQETVAERPPPAIIRIGRVIRSLGFQLTSRVRSRVFRTNPLQTVGTVAVAISLIHLAGSA